MSPCPIHPGVRDALSHAKITPYWLDSEAAPPPCPPLSADTDCDLLIVGGGFTGLWAALRAIEKDPARRIVLVDAGTIPNGASARACAMFNTSVLHGLKNAKRLFAGDLDVLEALGKQNFDDFLKTLDRHGIDAEVELNGELTVAVEAHTARRKNGKNSGQSALAELHREFKLHEAYGHDVAFLDCSETNAMLRSPLFRGAMHTRSKAGVLHPAKLCWGLKRAITALGVQVFENSPLGPLQDTGTRVTARLNSPLNTPLNTGTVSVTAKKAVLATNAFAAGHKKIRRRVTCIRDRVLVSEPLSARQISGLNWHGRQAAYDTRVQLNYFRLTADNRMLFGGRLGYFYGDQTDPAQDKTKQPFEPLVAAWLKTFPQLAGTKVDYVWGGPLAVTTRMAVHFQPYHGGKTLFIGGYSGFGVAATRFGAGLGLALLDGGPHPARGLAIATGMPRTIPPEPLRWIGAKITMHALDGADEKGGWRMLWLRFVKALGFPLY